MQTNFPQTPSSDSSPKIAQPITQTKKIKSFFSAHKVAIIGISILGGLVGIGLALAESSLAGRELDFMRDYCRDVVKNKSVLVDGKETYLRDLLKSDWTIGNMVPPNKEGLVPCHVWSLKDDIEPNTCKVFFEEIGGIWNSFLQKPIAQDLSDRIATVYPGWFSLNKVFPRLNLPNPSEIPWNSLKLKVTVWGICDLKNQSASS
jgi:hypothetical protein